ncbi:sugar transferase [Aquamicrobium sp. cd-1]|uniref:Sugar transferase n=1 Tax=Aquamicrobium zhengzhouense TaxID=2781738 RepID=A0ABS0S8U0_9HYPH|nr:sugar transferase [Aquamicrobium zhengzhouense]
MRVVAASRAQLLGLNSVSDSKSATRAELTFQSGLPLRAIAGCPVPPELDWAFRVRLGIKRVFDVVLALLALLVFAPFLLVIAAAIRLCDGKEVLFRQDREGLGGRPFQLLKFRTWHLGACDHSGISQEADRDRRVTWLGAVLRRTSIDELPQLFNVVKGDMSLVGPRPHVPNMRAGNGLYHQLVAYYYLRTRYLRPGMTGWAQINGFRGPTRNAALARRRIDHDLAYIQNFALTLDLWILLRTALGGFMVKPSSVTAARLP